jgi:hypothetical protein
VRPSAQTPVNQKINMQKTKNGEVTGHLQEEEGKRKKLRR